jgi:hypothetical protein
MSRRLTKNQSLFWAALRAAQSFFVIILTPKDAI